MADEVQQLNPGIVDSYIRNQTAYLQGSIVQADQKATFLFAIVGVLVGYMDNKQSLVDRGVVLFHWLGWQSLVAGISLSAAGCLTLAACYAGAVVWPRASKATTRRSASFVPISDEFPSGEEYAKDLLSVSEQEVLQRQLVSHHYRCGVCFQKWKLLKRAYALSAAGFLLFVLYFILAISLH